MFTFTKILKLTTFPGFTNWENFHWLTKLQKFFKFEYFSKTHRITKVNETSTINKIFRFDYIYWQFQQFKHYIESFKFLKKIDGNDQIGQNNWVSEEKKLPHSFMLRLCISTSEEIQLGRGYRFSRFVYKIFLYFRLKAQTNASIIIITIFFFTKFGLGGTGQINLNLITSFLFLALL